MNNKGFAITTVVYAIVLLLSLIMIISFSILKNEYIDQKDFVNEIRQGLSRCLKEDKC